MNNLPIPLTKNNLTLLIGSWEHEQILELLAALALNGHLNVLVGGNRFRAFNLARQIRRHTLALDETLERIHISRPSTCYQIIPILQQLTTAKVPFVALDLLQTFYDDVLERECYRLLVQIVGYLERLQRTVPVLITVRHSLVPEGEGLIQLLKKRADHVFIKEANDQMAVGLSASRLL